MVKTLIFLLLAFVGCCYGQTCRPGWTHTGHQCVKYFHEWLMYDVAQVKCLKLGAKIPSVHDAAENQILYNLATDHRWWTWLDGKAESQSMDFKWLDGTAMTYKNWAPGQPSANERLDYRCMRMGQFKNDQWSSYSCQNKYHGYVLCAHKEGDLTVPANPCKSGMVKIGSQCVKYIHSWVNFATAQARCTSLGMSMPVINSLWENTMLHGLTDQRWRSWLGIQNNKWMANQQTVSYTHWAVGQPSGTSTCSVMGNRGNDNWSDYSCTGRGYILCANPAPGTQKQEQSHNSGGPHFLPGGNTHHVRPKPQAYHLHKVVECDQGYDKFQGHCFKVMGGGAKTWNEGASACAEAGGWMVAVHNQGDADALANYIKTKTSGSDTVWTGGFAGIHSGNWKWTDNGVFNYQRFSSGNNGACMSFTADDKLLNKVGCSQTHAVICKTNPISYSA